MYHALGVLCTLANLGSNREWEVQVQNSDHMARGGTLDVALLAFPLLISKASTYGSYSSNILRYPLLKPGNNVWILRCLLSF